MKKILSVLRLICFVLLQLPAWAHSVENATEAQCTTTEKLYVSYSHYGPTEVEIVRPCSSQNTSPYVVLVSYLALVDKDYYSGANPDDAATADRDSNIFLFGMLARELAKRGLPVIKYDPIAIRSQPGQDTVDQDELLQVTREDFSGLLNSVLGGVDHALGDDIKRPIVFVAHSGGAFTVGDYLERHALNGDPALNRLIGFVGISPSVSNDTGTGQSHRTYWNRTLTKCLKQSNRLTCLTEIQSDPLFSQVFSKARQKKIAQIFSDSEDDASLLSSLNEYLIRIVAEDDSIKKGSVEGYGYINNRYKAKNRLFNSLLFRNPSAAPIARNATSSIIIFGDNDLIISHDIEREAWTSGGGNNRDVLLVQGAGHLLGHDRYFGPIRDDAKVLVVDSILQVAEKLRLARAAMCLKNKSKSAC